MKHLPIGGSTAARTIKCPAWLGLAKQLPKPKGNSAADEGNLLHDVMEDYYAKDIEFETQLREGRQYENEVLTQELIDSLAIPAREMVESVLDNYLVVDLICEPFVEIVKDEMGGSIDMLAISEDRKTLIVLDYKFGRKKVKAADNAQMLFYALAVREDIKTAAWFDHVETLACVIVQPRCSNEADVWETDIGHVQRFSDTLFKALETPNKEEAGGHCNYCPASATCKTKRSQADSALLMDKKDAKSVAEALKVADELEAWIKDVRALAHGYLDTGIIVPDFKLVDKRATKKWKDEKEAGALLGNLLGHDAAFKETLITPTQAIAAVKKAKAGITIDDLYVSKSSGTTIAPESDKRDAVIKNVTQNLNKLIDAGKIKA